MQRNENENLDTMVFNFMSKFNVTTNNIDLLPEEIYKVSSKLNVNNLESLSLIITWLRKSARERKLSLIPYSIIKNTDKDFNSSCFSVKTTLSPVYLKKCPDEILNFPFIETDGTNDLNLVKNWFFEVNKLKYTWQAFSLKDIHFHKICYNLSVYNYIKNNPKKYQNAIKKHSHCFLFIEMCEFFYADQGNNNENPLSPNVTYESESEIDLEETRDFNDSNVRKKLIKTLIDESYIKLEDNQYFRNSKKAAYKTVNNLIILDKENNNEMLTKERFENLDVEDRLTKEDEENSFSFRTLRGKEIPGILDATTITLKTRFLSYLKKFFIKLDDRTCKIMDEHLDKDEKKEVFIEAINRSLKLIDKNNIQNAFPNAALVQVYYYDPANTSKTIKKSIGGLRYIKDLLEVKNLEDYKIDEIYGSGVETSDYVLNFTKFTVCVVDFQKYGGLEFEFKECAKNNGEKLESITWGDVYNYPSKNYACFAKCLFVSKVNLPDIKELKEASNYLKKLQVIDKITGFDLYGRIVSFNDIKKLANFLRIKIEIYDFKGVKILEEGNAINESHVLRLMFEQNHYFLIKRLKKEVINNVDYDEVADFIQEKCHSTSKIINVEVDFDLETVYLNREEEAKLKPYSISYRFEEEPVINHLIENEEELLNYKVLDTFINNLLEYSKVRLKNSNITFDNHEKAEIYNKTLNDFKKEMYEENLRNEEFKEFKKGKSRKYEEESFANIESKSNKISFRRLNFIACAYNGSKFDFNFVFHYLVEKGFRAKEAPSLSGKMNCFSFYLSILDHAFITIEFWDLCNFTQGSLKNTAKAYKVETSKGEFDHKEIQKYYDEGNLFKFIEENREKIIEYNNTDVIVLTQIKKAVIDLFENELNPKSIFGNRNGEIKFGSNNILVTRNKFNIYEYPTLSSFAYKLFQNSNKVVILYFNDIRKITCENIRKKLYNNEYKKILKNNHPKAPDSKYLDEIVRKCIIAGKSHGIVGVHIDDDGFYQIDVVSLYPYVMFESRYPRGELVSIIIDDKESEESKRDKMLKAQNIIQRYFDSPETAKLFICNGLFKKRYDPTKEVCYLPSPNKEKKGSKYNWSLNDVDQEYEIKISSNCLYHLIKKPLTDTEVAGSFNLTPDKDGFLLMYWDDSGYSSPKHKEIVECNHVYYENNVEKIEYQASVVIKEDRIYEILDSQTAHEIDFINDEKIVLSSVNPREVLGSYDNPFKNYINHLFKIKQREDYNKDNDIENYNPVLREMSKLLMNAVSGKMIQKLYNEKNELINSGSKFKNRIESIFKQSRIKVQVTNTNNELREKELITEEELCNGFDHNKKFIDSDLFNFSFNSFEYKVKCLYKDKFEDFYNGDFIEALKNFNISLNPEYSDTGKFIYLIRFILESLPNYFIFYENDVEIDSLKYSESYYKFKFMKNIETDVYYYKDEEEKLEKEINDKLNEEHNKKESETIKRKIERLTLDENLDEEETARLNKLKEMLNNLKNQYQTRFFPFKEYDKIFNYVCIKYKHMRLTEVVELYNLPFDLKIVEYDKINGLDQYNNVKDPKELTKIFRTMDIKLHIINENAVYLITKDDEKINHVPSPLGVFIYSYSRSFMYMNIYRNAKTYVTDTDSALINVNDLNKVKDSLNEVNKKIYVGKPSSKNCFERTNLEISTNDKNLGDVEVEAYCNKAYYIAPKVYSLFTDEKCIKHRIKGVRQSDPFKVDSDQSMEEKSEAFYNIDGNEDLLYSSLLNKKKVVFKSWQIFNNRKENMTEFRKIDKEFNI